MTPWTITLSFVAYMFYMWIVALVEMAHWGMLLCFVMCTSFDDGQRSLQWPPWVFHPKGVFSPQVRLAGGPPGDHLGLCPLVVFVIGLSPVFLLLWFFSFSLVRGEVSLVTSIGLPQCRLFWLLLPLLFEVGSFQVRVAFLGCCILLFSFIFFYCEPAHRVPVIGFSEIYVYLSKKKKQNLLMGSVHLFYLNIMSMSLFKSPDYSKAIRTSNMNFVHDLEMIY